MTASMTRSAWKWTSAALPALALLTTVAAFGCAPKAHIKLMQEGDPIQPGDQINVGFNPTDTSIAVAITNFGDDPVQVLWHKSSLVSVDGQAMEIVHKGNRELPAALAVSGEDFSTIPSHSTLHDRIYARTSLHLDDDEVDVGTYFPVQCGAFDCDFGEDLAGRTIRLSLTFQRGSQEKTYEWRFRVVQAFYSIRGGRPDE